MAQRKNVLEFVREDDFVEYYIFPLTRTTNEEEEQCELKDLLKKVNKVVSKYSQNYLWHRDEFRLAIKPLGTSALDACDEKVDLPSHIFGITHYGDNIEDEWFIVFLLYQITKEIDNVIARVVDSDGEFLLIEAANYLPQWANPEVCENRVFLYQGAVHIVPPSKNTKTSDVCSSINEIHQTPDATKSSADIQNSVLNKISGYPDKTGSNLHRATVYLPVGVAAILKQKPNLIAPAIRSFCNRDSLDVKACRAMKYFPPEDRVYSRLTFTKCLYAMLTHSKYSPDRRTGWNIPATTSPQFKAHSLGVGIACGFEILVSQAKPNDDIENDRGWQVYLKSLKDKNYFKNLLEHSREYNDLMNKAKDHYINYRDTMQSTPLIGQEILNLTKTMSYNINELKQSEANLPEDDDESWLNVDPKELEAMMEEQYGQKKNTQVNESSDASSFTEKVSKFLHHISDLEGVEFPSTEINDESPVRPPRGVKSKGKSKVSFTGDAEIESEPNTKVNFDPSSFSCAVQNILDLMIPDDDTWDLESDSEMSDYGVDEDVNVEGCEVDQNKLQQYMEEMDRELAKTTIGQSFQRKEQNKSDTFDDVENFKPVDIDMNALKNVLKSYQAQMGDAGPASNMLGPMGVHLEPGCSNGNRK